MARKSNSEERRAEIVKALQTVMARTGYEKATVQAIAAEANLAPGLVHYHFRSKQEILVSLVDTLAGYGQQRFARLALEGKDAQARLRAYIEARLGLGAGAAPEVVAAWVMIGAEAVRQPEVGKVYQKAVASELELVTGLLADCRCRHAQPDTEARNLAAGLLALIEGAFQLASAAGNIMPNGYAVEAALRYVGLERAV